MKRLKYFSIIAAVTMLLTSCAGSNKESKKSDTLNVIFASSPQPHEREYVTNKFIKKFEEENGVKVNVDFVAQSDAVKKIKTEQDSKKIVTDVLLVDTANMSPYIDGNWMEDIKDVVKKSGNTYTDMFDDSTDRDGKKYFVPNTFDIYLLAANKEALKYLPEGIKEEDVVKGIKWEDYTKWAINIKNGEKIGKTMLPTSMTDAQLLYPIGGLGLSYGAKFPDFNSDEFKEAIKNISEIAAVDGFYPEQNQYTAPTDPLKSENVWLTFAHMSTIGSAYQASPNKFVIGAAPSGTKGAGSTAGAWCFGIQKDAPNKDLAKKFLLYSMKPEVNYDYAVGFGGALSPIKEVNDILDADDVIMKAGANMLENTIISGVPATEYKDWNAVKLLYGDLYNEIDNKKSIPSDDFLNDLQKKLDDLKK